MMITKKFSFVSTIFSLILVLSVANPVQAVAVIDTIYVTTQRMAYDSRTGNILVDMFVPEINDVGWEVLGSHSVAVISDTTHEIIKNITVDDGPVGIAYDSGKNEWFVVNQNSGTVSVISDSSLERVATISLGDWTFPSEIIYDSGMGKLFVYGGAGKNGTMWVISDYDNSVLATFSGIDPKIKCLTCDSDKAEIFVAYNYYSNGSLRSPNFISVMSDIDYSIIANITLGEYDGSFYSVDALVYDSGTGEVFVAYSDNFDFSSKSSSIAVVSDETNSVVATIPIEDGAQRLAYDSGMHEIFAAGGKNNVLSVLSDITRTVVATLPLEGYPNQLVYDSGKGEIFVAHFGNGIVSVISDSSSTSPTSDTSPLPSPTPSQSMPSNNTSPTLPVALNPPIVYTLLAIVIVIVAVASISLVYFRRRGGKQ